MITKELIQVNHKIESVKILPPDGENRVELMAQLQETLWYSF